MSTVRVQQEAFKPGEEISAFCADNSGSGGVAIFVGQMRDFSGSDRDSGALVATMTLEHYPGMAECQLTDLATEAKRRWPLDAVLVIHRYGDLALGDPIVLVAVASTHREPAFDACRFLMGLAQDPSPVLEKGNDTRGRDMGRGQRKRQRQSLPLENVIS